MAKCNSFVHYFTSNVLAMLEDDLEEVHKPFCEGSNDNFEPEDVEDDNRYTVTNLTSNTIS